MFTILTRQKRAALILCALLIAEASERRGGSASGQAEVLEDVDRVELTITDLMAEVGDTQALGYAAQPHRSICYQRHVAMAFTDALLSPDAVRKKVRCPTST